MKDIKNGGGISGLQNSNLSRNLSTFEQLTDSMDIAVFRFADADCTQTSYDGRRHLLTDALLCSGCGVGHIGPSAIELVIFNVSHLKDFRDYISTVAEAFQSPYLAYKEAEMQLNEIEWFEMDCEGRYSVPMADEDLQIWDVEGYLQDQFRTYTYKPGVASSPLLDRVTFVPARRVLNKSEIKHSLFFNGQGSTFAYLTRRRSQIASSHPYLLYSI